MQDSVNTVIHDTVHTMSFDTIHTVAYDTTHTTVFDTVRVVLDSSFTPQLLRDSQAFYSSAFSDVQFMIGILVSIFVAGVGIFFGLNYKWTIDSIKKETRLAVESETKMAIEDFNKKINKFKEEYRETIKTFSDKSKIITNKMMFAILAQAKITNDVNDSLRMYLILIKFVNDEFDVIHVTLVEIAVKEILARFFGGTVYPEINSIVCKSVYEELSTFRRKILDVDDKDFKRYVDQLEPFISRIKKELSARF